MHKTEEQLLNKIRTTQEADELNDELDVLLASFYEQGGAGFDYALRAKVRSWVANLLFQMFSREGREKADILEDIKKKLQGMKTFILGISFEPTEEIIEKVSYYVRKNIFRNCLLEINHMPEILAGAVIIYEGRYLDLSIRKIFKAEYEKNKDEILEKYLVDG